MKLKKSAILAQLTSIAARKQGLRWLVGLSSLPLFGVVAAFGIAPATETRTVPIHTVVETLALPPSEALPKVLASEFWQSEKIQRGDTFASLLDRLGVSSEDTRLFLQTARHAKTMRQLVPGRQIQAKVSDDGQLYALRYAGTGETLMIAQKQDGRFEISEQPIPFETRQVMKSATIRSSLYGATDAAGIPDAVAMQLVDIFSSDIDFHLDLRKGDKLSVVYETHYYNGDQIKSGRVLSAEFVNDGKAYRAVYFQGLHGQDGGQGGYYTPEGKNVRKAFLRSPLEFSRISSGFSSARYHPVLKEWRAHKGIDYAAPTGTRVKSVSDGTVAFVGKQGGYGNVVIIQHQGSYSTVYGHLSGFAKGLKKGDRVSQGDIIGYVGMTGLATGPHLHYEFKVSGVQRNPLTVALPAAFPIAPHLKAEFERVTQPLAQRLDLLRNTNLALLE
jgi:murein DD-endopeptidase MepM/ murein hydrolase activator NlpD